MRIQDEKITFNIFKALKHPLELEKCFMIDNLDQTNLDSKLIKDQNE